MRSRPQTVTIAAVLLAIFSVLFNLSFPLWGNAIPREEAVPAVIVFVFVVVGIAGLVGAAGLWLLKKWGIWLSIVVCVLSLLDNASGALGAPTATLQVVAAVGALSFALIIVLVVLPISRRAFAAS